MAQFAGPYGRIAGRKGRGGRLLDLFLHQLPAFASPFVEAWYEKYKNDGLAVIGVHTPEFAFEKDPSNVT